MTPAKREFLMREMPHGTRVDTPLGRGTVVSRTTRAGRVVEVSVELDKERPRWGRFKGALFPIEDVELAIDPYPFEGLDPRTTKHLEAWLKHSVYEDERDEVRRKILALVQEEPDLVETRSWPEIRRMAEVEFGDVDVASEIWRQLGRARVMIGAKDPISGHSGRGRPMLTFKIGANPKRVNWIRVIYDPADTYTVQFGRGYRDPVVVSEVDDVYADNLAHVIEMHTGMRTSL